MTDTVAPAASFPASLNPPAAGRNSLASLFSALSEDDAASYRYLLVLRFLVLNVVAVALLAAAWLKGWVTAAFANDSTQLVAVIAVVFGFGLFSCGRKIFLTSSELNQLTDPRGRRSPRVARYLAGLENPDGQSRALAASALKLKFGARIAPIRHIANSLVFLGLIGTVIGFIIALSGIDPDAAADIDSIGPMVSTLISGMSVALYTTLVGVDPERLADGQLSAAGDRHRHARDHVRRAGRAPCTGLISSTTRTAPRSSAMSSRWRSRGSSRWSCCSCRISIRPANGAGQHPAAWQRDRRAALAGRARQRCRPLGRGAGRHPGRLLQQGRRDLQPAARRSRQAAPTSPA